MDYGKAFEIAMKAHGQPVRISELSENMSRGLKEQLTLFNYWPRLPIAAFWITPISTR